MASAYSVNAVNLVRKKSATVTEIINFFLKHCFSIGASCTCTVVEHIFILLHSSQVILILVHYRYRLLQVS